MQATCKIFCTGSFSGLILWACARFCSWQCRMTILSKQKSCKNSRRKDINANANVTRSYCNSTLDNIEMWHRSSCSVVCNLVVLTTFTTQEQRQCKQYKSNFTASSGEDFDPFIFNKIRRHRRISIWTWCVPDGSRFFYKNNTTPARLPCIASTIKWITITTISMIQAFFCGFVTSSTSKRARIASHEEC